MKLSVIIPAINEAEALGHLLPLLSTVELVHEVIVCDGGSRDETTSVARAHGALVVISQRNRGAQMNAGAQAATGDVLWFLHADTRPHLQSAQFMRRALRNRRIIGGNFRLRFDERSQAARMFEVVARVQRLCGIYYGDSGIWLRRDVFEKLDGYRAWPLFEDYDLARRLQKFARRNRKRTVCVGAPLIVSARRFRQGTARLFSIWLGFQFLFSLGVSPHKLARLYHRT